MGIPVRIMRPYDFHLFGPLNKNLAYKLFATDADVKQAATSWLRTLDNNLLSSGMPVLAVQWIKCLDVSGDRMEVWCVPSATHEGMYTSKFE